MDLDSFGRQDLSDLFLTHYNNIFSTMKTDEDRKLFVYYKSYRANIRAKVSGLRARSTGNAEARNLSLAEADKYLKLMNHYMKVLI